MESNDGDEFMNIFWETFGIEDESIPSFAFDSVESVDQSVQSVKSVESVGPRQSAQLVEPDQSVVSIESGSSDDIEKKKKIRKQKVARYLEKKSRRRWCKGVSYKVRHDFAKVRPRYKGRFLPVENKFVPISELKESLQVNSLYRR